MLNAGDVTLPDLLIGEEGVFLGSVVVMNTTKMVLRKQMLQVDGLGRDPVLVKIEGVPPLSIRKVAFSCPWSGRVPEGWTGREVEIRLSISGEFRDIGPSDEVKLKVGVRKPTEKHKRTFISGIDGSVQYYSVVPPPEGTDLSGKKALILSLHGASVEATNQANCYKQRDWCYVVCPTNRRPYGFDWEDWDGWMRWRCSRRRGRGSSSTIADIPDGALDGRARDMEHRRAVPGNIRGAGSERGVDQLLVLHGAQRPVG